MVRHRYKSILHHISKCSTTLYFIMPNTKTIWGHGNVFSENQGCFQLCFTDIQQDCVTCLYWNRGKYLDFSPPFSCKLEYLKSKVRKKANTTQKNLIRVHLSIFYKCPCFFTTTNYWLFPVISIVTHLNKQNTIKCMQPTRANQAVLIF